MTATTHPSDEVAGLGLRLANLMTGRGPTLGVEAEGGVLDVPSTAERLGLPAPRDTDELLQARAAPQLRAVMEAVGREPAAAVRLPLEAAVFAPLVTRPEKIICVGFNYREHAAETGTPIPKRPPLFSKFNNALNSHKGVVRLPTRVDDRFDYETELVIVFGRECRDASEGEALDYVAGYAVGNDVSARTLQMQTSQFLAGKTSDGFAPLGPWLVTRDRVPDPNGLKLQTRVNGEVRQDWTTRDMIFNCRQLIAFASSVMTLKPGDLLFTGTPQGVILGEKIPPEERRWLRAGDEVVSSLEGLGELRVTMA
jgi:2-keto-4-pentenoate hydratase/2-oxohepta-3-ene-1,7-dioic acid hydratase in catechol pathway